jgi:hypothetical protein
MLRRCTNPKASDWPEHGGKGISVCQEWSDSDTGFARFCEDVGPRPSPKHRLNRLNRKLNYSKDNCRWAIGQRRSLSADLVEFGGLAKTPGQWSIIVGVPESTLRTRLKTMSPEQAFLKPIRGDRSNTTWFVRFEGLHANKPVTVDSTPESAVLAYTRWNRLKNKAVGKMSLIRKSINQIGTVETTVLVHCQE